MATKYSTTEVRDKWGRLQKKIQFTAAYSGQENKERLEEVQEDGEDGAEQMILPCEKDRAPIVSRVSANKMTALTSAAKAASTLNQNSVDVLIAPRPDPTLDAMESPVSSSDSTRMPFANIVEDGTIVWYRYNKRNWEWPAVIFKSWESLQSWGLPLPSKIYYNAERFCENEMDGVSGDSISTSGGSDGSGSSLLPLPSGCTAIAFFCGPKCEYGLVRDESRLRVMTETDEMPHNSGMSSRVSGDFQYAVCPINE